MPLIIKPLTSEDLPISIKNLNNQNVDKIDFLFKKVRNPSADVIVKKTYTNSTNQVEYDKTNEVYKVRLSVDDTGKFLDCMGKTVWLDIRPVIQEDRAIPMELIPVKVAYTLYSRSDIGVS